MSSILSFLVVIAKYGISVAITYLLVVLGYRVFLHPLSRYPGPLLAKITDAYAGYYVLRQTLPYRTWLNHVKYGPILRHGPNRLIFNTASALQDIYQSDKTGKSSVYDLTRQANGVVNIFNALDNDVHRRKRRLVGYAVTERAMRSFEPTMTSQIDVFLRRALATNREPMDMAPTLKQLTLDVVCLLGFGYPLNNQTDEKNRWLGRGLVYGNYRVNCCLNFPSLRHLRIDALMRRLMPNGPAQFRALIDHMVQTRLAQDDDAKPDFFSALRNTERALGEKPTPIEEIWQEAVFFIPAGADTTSAAMSALLFYLTRHPEVYKKLAEEIRSAFTDVSEITGGPRLVGCQYLRACIEEALRMSPPVAGTLWRQQATEQPLVVDGHIVPKDVEVGVNIFALHHNEKYFPDPFSFRPERWLESNTSEDQRKVMYAAFAPFSLGARSCAGKAMAYLEISLTIAKLLWYFDVEQAPGDLGKIGNRKTQVPGTKELVEDFDMYDVFAANHNGPFLVFKPRKETIDTLTA